MENRHLIAKQVFELRVGFNQAQVPQLQNAFSQHYWQSVAPALEKLFDRLVGADELVRVDRLELDAGRWSADDIMSGRFVEGLILSLEAVIADALRGTGTHVDVLPMRIGQFDLWLNFLEHGYLPGAASQPDSEAWQQAILSNLSAEDTARYSLSNLLSRQPAALERLILQHDAAFLQQLLEHFSGQAQGHLPDLLNEIVDTIVRVITDPTNHSHAPDKATPAELETIAAVLFDVLTGLADASVSTELEATLRHRILEALSQEVANPAELARWLLQADTWKILLGGVVAPGRVDRLSQQAAATLRDNIRLQAFAQASLSAVPATRELERRIELAVWRVLLDDVVIRGNDNNTTHLLTRIIRADALLPWQGQLIRALDNKVAGGGEDHNGWARVADAIQALPPLLQEQHEETKPPHRLDNELDAAFTEATTPQPFSEVQEYDVFYVQAVGVILLHPFLPRLFEKLQLCAGRAFIDEASQQRAVCLIHHLATGELRTPEYKLVLPKFLCGMPLNAPLDHFIEISGAEQDECANLMVAAIGHWGALGNSSPDWLREMFFQRDGKLEKCETGWQLRVERKAQDVLLDRLPHGWGLGMVKLPWMDELLRIDW